MSLSLRLISAAIAAIPTAFGIYAFIQPEQILPFFELNAPATASEKKLVDTLVAVYGVRDTFLGLAVWIAAYFGDQRTLGWMMIAGGGVAFGDGVVCRTLVGSGEWNHWGYMPLLVVVGSLLLV